MSYLRPVNPTGICSWYTHTRRIPPSQEAGVDYYCPIGTPIRAAGNGRVVSVAGGIAYATGRFVTIDLDDGRRVRYLHLSKWLVRTGDRVSRGQIIALSGASGYGSEFFGGSSFATIPWNTGGPHVHTTLWPTHAYSFGTTAGTLDIELYTDKGALSGDTATAFPTEEDDMFDDDARAKLQAVYDAVFNGGPSMEDANRSIGRSLALLQRIPANVWATPVDRGLDASGQPVMVPALQELADVKTYVLALLARDGGDVDEVALAAALAPLLTQSIGSLTDADLQRIATASADESDRRERKRLGEN